jgi:hypothetical protein
MERVFSSVTTQWNFLLPLDPSTSLFYIATFFSLRHPWQPGALANESSFTPFALVDLVLLLRHQWADVRPVDERRAFNTTESKI